MLAYAERRRLSWAADYQAAVNDVQLDAEQYSGLLSAQNHALRFGVNHAPVSG